MSEVLGITLTRRNAKDITAQMAGFPHHALDSYLPKLVRAGKRVAICDEPSAAQESAPRKERFTMAQGNRGANRTFEEVESVLHR